MLCGTRALQWSHVGGKSPQVTEFAFGHAYDRHSGHPIWRPESFVTVRHGAGDADDQEMTSSQGTRQNHIVLVETYRVDHVLFGPEGIQEGTRINKAVNPSSVDGCFCCFHLLTSTPASITTKTIRCKLKLHVFLSNANQHPIDTIKATTSQHHSSWKSTDCFSLRHLLSVATHFRADQYYSY